MSYLINENGIARLRQQYADGNPYVMYPVWYNQTWPQNVDPVYSPQNIYLLWAITGDQKWIDLLTEKFHVPSGPLDKNTRRECGVYWISMHTLMAPHWTPERLLELETELKVFMTNAISGVYSWDADERISILVQAAMMDEKFGTAYLKADSKDTASPYYCSMETVPQHLAMQQEAWQHESIDGPSSESAGYTINTYKSTLYGIACLNDLSVLPGLSEWLPKFREFMVWSISSDYKQVINYGDAETPLSQLWENAPWYRIPMLALFIGMGLDEDGTIADIIAGIAEWRAKIYNHSGEEHITRPEHLHSILNWGAHLVTDMSLIPLEGPRKPLPTGLKVFRNFGAIYRDEKCYFYATAQVWLHDDHDYRKGMTDYRLYVVDESWEGARPVNRPGEYGGTWIAYNSACIKGQTEFYDRGLDSAELINGKVIIKAHHRGPRPADNGKPIELGPFDYVGHEWLTTIEFTPADIGTDTPCLKARYDWKHDGVFPDPAWSPYMQDLREYAPFEAQQYIAGGEPQLDESQKQLEFIDPVGYPVKIKYDGSERVGLTPWTWYDKEYFKRFRMFSDRHEGFHELTTTVGVKGEPPPPPPPPAPTYVDPPVPDEELPTPAVLTIVDNTSPGYSAWGPWIRYPGQGIGDAVDYIGQGDGSQFARWRVKVSPGVYNIATIWMAAPNRATNSPFKISLGDTVIQTVIVNQEISPNSFTDNDGVTWHTLADVTVNSDAILTVELTNEADEFVIADAVRIEKISDVEPPPPVDPPPLPELQLPLTFQNGKYKVDRDDSGIICLKVQPPAELYEKD